MHVAVNHLEEHCHWWQELEIPSFRAWWIIPIQEGATLRLSHSHQHRHIRWFVIDKVLLLGLCITSTDSSWLSDSFWCYSRRPESRLHSCWRCARRWCCALQSEPLTSPLNHDYILSTVANLDHVPVQCSRVALNLKICWSSRKRCTQSLLAMGWMPQRKSHARHRAADIFVGQRDINSFIMWYSAN